MKLNIGTHFSIPLDAVVQTFAILAIRGAGKTCTAIVIAEEMCKANLPWIAFDPVGVWWGLRADKDGSPKGYPVVVIGGQHADIKLEKKSGADLAEDLIAEPICAVIDLSLESKRFWHTFLTDFCLKLMELNPHIPRHLFIEEAPEFVPQRTRVDLTMRCKEAIERLIRLGRNRGYGCTLISQRPATVDKDVLSQCENLFVLRTTGPHDRKALEEWIEVKATDKKMDQFWDDLAGLPNGTAWFWSPYWLNKFERVVIRQRETFHPGATRQVGKEIKDVSLLQMNEFVARLHARFPSNERKQARLKTSMQPIETPREINYEDQIASLHQRINEERAKRIEAEKRLSAVRKMLEPQYLSLKGLFEELSTNAATVVDKSAYDLWLAKAGKAGTKRLLETLIDRGELTRNQLATLSGLSPRSGTFSQYLSWLNRNGLIEKDGEMIRLRPL